MKEDEKRQGIRKDPPLYGHIMKAYERSHKYLEDRGIFKMVEKYQKMYEADMWRAKGLVRKEHLQTIDVAVMFDTIEIGANVVCSRVPVPNIKPIFDSNYQKYAELKALLAHGIMTNDQTIVEQANTGFDDLKSEIREYADKLQRQLINIWHDSEMAAKNRIGYREKCKFGIFILKSEFDYEKKGFINEPVAITDIFPSPDVASIKKHEYEPFIYAPVLPTKEVEKKYGVNELEDKAIGDMTTFSNTTGTKGVAARINAAIKNILRGGDDKKVPGYCRVIECYMPANEEETEEYEEEQFKTNDDGFEYDAHGNPVKETITNTRAKFPSGYKRVTIVKDHQDWILEEIDFPYKRPPFFANVNYEQLGDMYGIPEMMAVENLVVQLNLAASNVADNIRLFGNPKLVLPNDARGAEPDVNQDIESEEITNEPGGIIYTDSRPYYLEPPSLGFDPKWWMDWLKASIDRILHITDAIRGFNEFSQDSGRKVQELRKAAMGSFTNKIEEQSEFYCSLYKYWTWVLQNLWEGEIVQEIEDDFGDTTYEEFDPGQGNGLKIDIRVSSKNILPDDPWSSFEEVNLLFDKGAAGPEHLIEYAPTVEDKQRLRRWLSEQQKKQDQQQARELAYEQMKQAIDQVNEVSNQAPGTADEETAAMPLIDLINQFPELIKAPEFQKLNTRLKVAIIAKLANAGQYQSPPELTEAVQV